MEQQKNLENYVDQMVHQMNKKTGKVLKVLSDITLYSHRPYFL